MQLFQKLTTNHNEHKKSATKTKKAHYHPFDFAYRFRFVICEILFSAKFRYLKFSSLKKQASIEINSQPTTSRDSKECPTASIPLKVAVVVEMRLNSIKLCVFERDLNESIGMKAISILAKVPI